MTSTCTTQYTMAAAGLQAGTVLDDRSSTGRRRPWKEHKMANELLSAAYEDVNPSKAERLRDCASQLEFARDADVPGRKRLVSANFCRVRLCPICAWRRSLKLQSQMMDIARYLGQERSRQYILLTLTVRNVAPEDLSRTLDDLFRAWQRIMQRKQVRRAVKGYCRSLEITHNVTEDTYHPHIHALLLVAPDYFKHSYISQATWAEHWRTALGVDYTPIVDVRRVKGRDAGAIAEVSKYVVKAEDYLIPDDWDMTVDTVRLLDEVLAKRRLVAYGGLVKDAHRKLHLDDAEDGDLLNLGDKPEDYDPASRVVYVWYSGYRQYIARP